MLDFDRFIAALGPDANRYTPAELRQLHIDSQKLAEMLWTLVKAQRVRRSDRRPPDIDKSGTDRTLRTSSVTPPLEAVAPSADPP